MAPRTPTYLRSLSTISPALAAEMQAHPIRDPEPSDPYYGRTDHFARRAHRAAILAEKWHLRYLPSPVPEVREEDRKVRVRDGEEIGVRVYTPVAEAEGRERPLCVMFHEGGWCMGDLTDEEVNCRLFARELGAVCVNVDYRLAPEHKFPTGINDCWDALEWAAHNAAELGATPSAGFIVGGGSAGGNISAVLAHLARDARLSPPLTGQYLCVPSITGFLPPEELPAKYRPEYLSNPTVTPNHDPVASADAEGARALVEDIVGADRSDPRIVPFHYGALPGGHAGLPPAYFQVCGLDPLRDEGLIYERVLREEYDIPTRLDLYPGLCHYFWTNFPRLEASKKFVEDTVEGVRWLLER